MKKVSLQKFKALEDAGKLTTDVYAVNGVLSSISLLDGEEIQKDPRIVDEQMDGIKLIAEEVVKLKEEK